MNDKLPEIKFLYRYKKMPPMVESLSTYVTKADVIQYDQLTPDQIKEDTETVDGKHFMLPHRTLIRVSLWTAMIPKPVIWHTLRAYSKSAYERYVNLRGKEVNIVICQEVKPHVYRS